jgi:dTDP-4-amino-4,6-dideoxygalactose transaminase
LNYLPFEKPIYITQPLLPSLEELTRRLETIWKSGVITNIADQHKELEGLLSKYLESPFLSLYNNGTTALISAINALQLEGEVITTPFTFAATAHALPMNRLVPVFCDIDPDTMTLAPEAIEKAITPRTSAILAVHVYGIPCDVEAIGAIARKHSLKVIYDAAHAFNTRIDNRPIHEWGDLTVYSFHATKFFHTGEGGAIACRSSELKSEVDRLRNFGIKNEEEVLRIGLNGKMTEIQAALGIEVFELYKKEIGNRRELYNYYSEEIESIEGLFHCRLPMNVSNSYQYFVIRVKKDEFGMSRDELYTRLRDYNVFARKYFYPLCSDYDCYKDLPERGNEKLTNAQTVSEEVLCLPYYGRLLGKPAESIVGIIKQIKSSNK